MGAESGSILGLVVRQGLIIVGVGLAAGILGSVILTRLIQGLLYGVSPTDLPTLGAVIFLVLLVSAIASLLPSIRASRVEPMQVLRDE